MAWKDRIIGWIIGGIIAGIIATLGATYIQSQIDGRRDPLKTCLANHDRQRENDQSQAPFHIILTGLKGDDNQHEYRRLVRSLRDFVQDLPNSPLHFQTIPCDIAPNQDDLAEADSTGRANAETLATTYGADVVIWGEVVDAGQSLEL